MFTSNVEKENKNMEKAKELKKLEKKVGRTRLSSLLFVGALVIGSLLNVPLDVLAPIEILSALALVVFIGIPTQKKLFALRKEIAQEGSTINE